MLTIERELKDKIMTTEVFISISSDKYNEEEINRDIDLAILHLKHFELRYSRFRSGNILHSFNKSTEFKLDGELSEILQKSKDYYIKTKGIFDPGILNDLNKEGYQISKDAGFFDNRKIDSHGYYSFENIEFINDSNLVKKPKNLEIDLGGIGKGYMVDKISKNLKRKYKDFCVNLGGDMYVAGRDQSNNFPHWGIEIENPFNDDLEMPLLLVKDKAVATSGINKRHWTKDGKVKNHIINPKTKSSVENELICVTVISGKPIEADIYAKTALILGKHDGMDFCNNRKIPVIMITKDKKIVIGKYANKYIWKNS